MKAIWIFMCLAFTVLATHAHGLEVVSVNGNAVEIAIHDGETLKPNSYYYLVDKAGKNRGVVKTGKEGDDLAHTTLIKGKAFWAWTVGQPAVRNAKRSAASTPSPQAQTVATADTSYKPLGPDRFRLGFGMNQFALSGDMGSSVTLKPLSGFTLGAFYESVSDDNDYVLETGLLYSQGGYQIDFGTLVSMKVSTTVLEVPLMVKGIVMDGDQELRIKGGFLVSYLLNSKIEGTAFGGTNPFGTSGDKGFIDYSLALGAEYHFMANQHHPIWIDFTYNMGLKNYDSSGASTVKSRMLLLMAGTTI